MEITTIMTILEAEEDIASFQIGDMKVQTADDSHLDTVKVMAEMMNFIVVDASIGITETIRESHTVGMKDMKAHEKGDTNIEVPAQGDTVKIVQEDIARIVQRDIEMTVQGRTVRIGMMRDISVTTVLVL